MVPAPKKAATLADFLAIPEEERFHEIIDGELVQKAQPTFRHGGAQAKLAAALDPFNRRQGEPPDRPGGWWIATEVDVLFSGLPLRPDVAGWRRERVAEPPDDALVRTIPDWVCEVLSSADRLALARSRLSGSAGGRARRDRARRAIRRDRSPRRYVLRRGLRSRVDQGQSAASLSFTAALASASWGEYQPALVATRRPSRR